jgi:phosphatidylserine decarboxylase
MSQLFVSMQYLLPQHTFSRVVWAVTRIQIPWIKDALIGAFMRGFAPAMDDAIVTDPHAYASFNAFFTRALRSDARPIAAEAAALACPVDGTVSQAGAIAGEQLFQAKGHSYSLDALLAGAAPGWSARFTDGVFATVYLAPYNYHRIHMPCDGVLQEAWYVPGRLFSVNAVTAAAVPGLFARNERIVLLFAGAGGAFAVILVGALFVGSMATVWHGDVTPRRPRRPTRLPLEGLHQPLALSRGAELGRFNMGSTVILLFGKDRAALLQQIQAGRVVRMGERIGQLPPAAARDA